MKAFQSKLSIKKKKHKWSLVSASLWHMLPRLVSLQLLFCGLSTVRILFKKISHYLELLSKEHKHTKLIWQGTRRVAKHLWKAHCSFGWRHHKQLVKWRNLKAIFFLLFHHNLYSTVHHNFTLTLKTSWHHLPVYHDRCIGTNIFWKTLHAATPISSNWVLRENHEAVKVWEYNSKRKIQAPRVVPETNQGTLPH